jgi:carotenoid 1,2-hydratase
VFSPYYKKSGRGDPLNHSSLNVALYGPQHRWVMTERGRGAVARDASNLEIGPSAVHWDGEALTIDIVEGDTRLFVPWQRPVVGRVRVFPEALNRVAFALDGKESHIWHCLAPRARIEVEMQSPGISWSGKAYLDHNRGAEALEKGFNTWHWSRAHLKEGALVCYEGERGDGSLFASALRFDARGVPEPVDLPPIAALPDSKWGITRRTRSDIGVAEVVKLPEEETNRRWQETTPQWPIMHTVLKGVTRDQMMARHKSNHIQVVYCPNEKQAHRAARIKAAAFAELGLETHLCGDVKLG